MGVFNIDRIISEKMDYVNRQLKKRYYGLSRDRDKKLKDILLRRAVRSMKLSRSMPDAIKRLAGDRPLVGVDGSINMVGSSYPHYLALIRAMAKSTRRDHEDIVLVDVHYPGFAAAPSRIYPKAAGEISSQSSPEAGPFPEARDAASSETGTFPKTGSTVFSETGSSLEPGSFPEAGSSPKAGSTDFSEAESSPRDESTASLEDLSQPSPRSSSNSPSTVFPAVPPGTVPEDGSFTGTHGIWEGRGISGAAADENRRSAKMAQLEIETAIQSLEAMDPFLIMLDGSLVQYRIKCKQAWEEFYDLVLKKGVLVVGVIEEIKTDFLYPVIREDVEWDADGLSDRELLFGLLDVGEMLVVDERVVQPSKEGLVTCFVRLSRDPHPIALDMLKEQQEHLYDTACLLYSLTSKDGRGIPLWLDIVDREVRITDRMMESLVDCYIDEDLRYRLLRAKRENRGY